MSYHLRVLHSLVTLSRSNSAPSRAVLLNRAGGTEAALEDALDTLVSLGLIREDRGVAEPLRLTLEGLAVGAAYAARTAQQAEATATATPTHPFTIEEPVRVRAAGSVRRAPRDRRAVARSRTVASRAA